MATIGKKITKEQARSLILNYSTEKNWKDPKWAWAELFSIEILREFMEGVALHDKENPKEPIKYVRFYYGRTSPVAGSDDKPNDLVIIGATSFENDVPNLDLPTINNLSKSSGEKSGGGGNTYGNGSPCPNTCNP